MSASTRVGVGSVDARVFSMRIRLVYCSGKIYEDVALGESFDDAQRTNIKNMTT